MVCTDYRTYMMMMVATCYSIPFQTLVLMNPEEFLRPGTPESLCHYLGTAEEFGWVAPDVQVQTNDAWGRFQRPELAGIWRIDRVLENEVRLVRADGQTFVSTWWHFLRDFHRVGTESPPAPPRDGPRVSRWEMMNDDDDLPGV